MRRFRVISRAAVAALLILCFSGCGFAAERRDTFNAYRAVPYISAGVFRGSLTAEADALVMENARNTAAARYRFLVGNMGERIMDGFLASRGSGYVPINSNIVDGGRQGIDGLYVRYNKHGIPMDVVVGEAKFNTSQLGMTKDGIQMSPKWIKHRLTQTANRFTAFSDKVRSGAVTQVSDRSQIVKNSSYGEVRISRGRTIHVWTDSKTRKLCYWSDKPVTNGELTKVLDDHAQIFRAKAANGDFRATVSRIIPGKGSSLTIKLETWAGGIEPGKAPTTSTVFDIDADSGRITRTTIGKDGRTRNKVYEGEGYTRLQTQIKKSIEQVLTNDIAINEGLSPDEAAQKARALLKGKSLTEILTAYQKYVKIPWGTLAKQSAMTGLFAAGAGALLDMVAQLAVNGTIDLKQTAQIAGLGGLSAMAAHSASTAANLGLATKAGKAAVQAVAQRFGVSASTVTGAAGLMSSALVGAAVFNVGMWAMGKSSIGDAMTNTLTTAAIGAVPTLATQGIMLAVGTFGHTAGGAAIASLHGAAYTNAILAYIGGGSVAAGGGGMAAGAALLSTVSGVLIVIPIAFAGYKMWRAYWNGAEEKELFERRLEMTCSKYH